MGGLIVYIYFREAEIKRVCYQNDFEPFLERMEDQAHVLMNATTAACSK